MSEEDSLDQVKIVYGLFKQLIDMLDRESKDCDIIYAKNTIRDLIDYIEDILQSDISQHIDMELVKNRFKIMFLPYGGLTEFFIWRDNFEERLRENQKLDGILERLFKILST